MIRCSRKRTGSIYNITDQPTILSGDRPLFLEPHANRLKLVGASHANPGIRVNLSRNNGLEMWPDPFSRYAEVGYKFDGSYFVGTLIRAFSKKGASQRNQHHHAGAGWKLEPRSSRTPRGRGSPVPSMPKKSVTEPKVIEIMADGNPMLMLLRRKTVSEDGHVQIIGNSK